MALHWNILECPDPDSLKADTPDGWPATDCTIWLCMICGVARITEKNAEAFWHRVHDWETITGPINNSGRRMEPHDIVRRIGLETNASELTDAQWRKRLIETMRCDSEDAWRKTRGGTLSRATLNAMGADPYGPQPASSKVRG